MFHGLKAEVYLDIDGGVVIPLDYAETLKAQPRAGATVDLSRVKQLPMTVYGFTKPTTGLDPANNEEYAQAYEMAMAARAGGDPTPMVPLSMKYASELIAAKIRPVATVLATERGLKRLKQPDLLKDEEEWDMFSDEDVLPSILDRVAAGGRHIRDQAGDAASLWQAEPVEAVSLRQRSQRPSTWLSVPDLGEVPLPARYAARVTASGRSTYFNCHWVVEVTGESVIFVQDLRAIGSALNPVLAIDDGSVIIEIGEIMDGEIVTSRPLDRLQAAAPANCFAFGDLNFVQFFLSK